MKTVAFFNKKGGVGKTTLCINLASILAQKNKKILIIDADPQCNTTNTFLAETNKTLCDLIENKETLYNIIEKTNIKNIDLVPCSKFFTDTIIQMYSKKNREYILKNSLETLNINYDFIFIDCNASLDISVVNALVASDEIIVPIQSSNYSLEGFVDLKEFIKSIQFTFNKNIKIKKVVLNNIDRRTKLHLSVFEAFNEAFPRLLAKTTISQNSIYDKMQFSKETIVNNRFSKAYKELKNLLKELGYYV